MRKSVTSFIVMSLVTISGHSFAQSRNGGQVFLDFESISKVMEKLPPVMTMVSGRDNTNWSCEDLDLSEHCSDLDGCTVSLHMQHKLDPNDMVRGIKEYLYFENSLTSLNKNSGVNGYTRQSAGGEHGWITGTAGLYTLFAPWGWAGAYNYRPAFCPAQNSRNSPAHRNPYLITVASHPHIHTVVILED
jgi:hypothetical protein